MGFPGCSKNLTNCGRLSPGWKDSSRYEFEQWSKSSGFDFYSLFKDGNESQLESWHELGAWIFVGWVWGPGRENQCWADAPDAKWQRNQTCHWNFPRKLWGKTHIINTLLENFKLCHKILFLDKLKTDFWHENSNSLNCSFLTVRVISHGPISLKIVVLVLVVLGDILLKFQYIGKIHKILEKFTKYWNDSQNIGMIHKILEKFTKYWNYSQNIGMIHKILEKNSKNIRKIHKTS